MSEPGPISLRNARTSVRTNIQHRLRTIGKLFHLWLLCTACLFMSGCSGSTGTTKTTSAGPTVQVVETTGDRAMLLQAQPSVAFVGGASSSGLVVTVDA